MRKKFIGGIAALVLGAGGALAQSAPKGSPTPTPVAQAGAFGGGLYDSQLLQAQHGNPPVLPPMPGMMGGEAPGMMGGPEGMGMPPGGPMGGMYGGQPWESPDIGGGLFDATSTPRFWVDGSYLLLFPESGPSGFPLLTTSAPADFGRVGNPTTILLAGANNRLNLGTASGMRLSTGFWRRGDQRVGVEVGALYVSPVSNNVFLQGSDGGIPLLARPFVNDVNGNNLSLVISAPGSVSGSALSRFTSSFWGIEANGLWNAYRTCPGEARSWSLNLLGGYRFVQLNETLTMSSRSTVIGGAPIPVGGVLVGQNTSIEVQDRFETLNKFHGAQVGMQSQFTSGRWYVGLTGKVAFGMVNQKTTVTGSTNTGNPILGSSTSTLGGLFANAGNIGIHKRDEFGILTDLNATLGFHFTSWLTGTVGYNFVHLNATARPGNMFNGRVDPNVVPLSGNFGAGVTQPRPFNYRQDDYFVHGVNFGFQVRY